jgi:hypothetical protein
MFVGFVSMMTGTLQDDMVPLLGKLQIRGQALLGKGSPVVAAKGVCKHDGS